MTMPARNDLAPEAKLKLTKNDMINIRAMIEGALQDVQGVLLSRKNFMFTSLAQCFPKYFGGIVVNSGKKGGINIALYLFILFGYNIPEISLKTQEIIKRDFAKNNMYIINSITLNILGFERGQK